MRRRLLIGFLLVLTLATPSLSEAAIDPETKVALDTLWVLLTAFLVFFMNAGFALVESGLCRAKNAVNILAKNFIVFAASSVAFWVVGFALMFGNGSDYLGLSGWLLHGADNSPATGDAYQGVFAALNWTGVPLYAKFFFQLVFAGTAATIVSGAVAERIKFVSFVVFSFILVAVDLSDRRTLGMGWRLAVEDGLRSISPVRRWCTVLAVGPRSRASSCSARGWENSPPMARSGRYCRTT